MLHEAELGMQRAVVEAVLSAEALEILKASAVPLNQTEAGFAVYVGDLCRGVKGGFPLDIGKNTAGNSGIELHVLFQKAVDLRFVFGICISSLRRDRRQQQRQTQKP